MPYNLRVAINAVSLTRGGGCSVLMGLLEQWRELGTHVHCIVFASNKSVISAMEKFVPFVTVVPFCVGAQPAWHFAAQQLTLGREVNHCKANVVLTVNHTIGRCRVPQVVHHQNLLRFQSSGAIRRAMTGDISNAVRDWFARRSLRVASANVFISEYLLRIAQSFAPLGIQNGSVVYNGIDSSSSQSKAGHSNSFRIPGLILAVQRDDKHKNGETLVQMMREIVRLKPEVDWRLRIVGNGSWKEVTFLARKENVLERIELGKFADPDELSKLYRSASVLVFPSFVEAFGLPPLEAMSHGLPVVASNATAIPEVVGDAGILIPPDDATQFALAVIRLHDDPAYRQTLVDRGFERIDKFNPSVQAIEMLRILESVAK